MTDSFYDDPQQYADEHGLDYCGLCGTIYAATPDDIDNGHDCPKH